mmetsp:Transcript_30544/g.55390  ORF Transcript_30544/g.55390 Transcript_30544/m.55390 type:complete len:313 (+) Transcript_30544:1380-2318(+)
MSCHTGFIPQSKQHAQAHLQRARGQEVLSSADHEGTHSQVFSGGRRLRHLVRFHPIRGRDHLRTPRCGTTDRKRPRVTQCLIGKGHDLRLAILPPPSLRTEDTGRGPVDFRMKVRIPRPQVTLDQLLVLLSVFPRDYQIIIRCYEPREFFEPVGFPLGQDLHPLLLLLRLRQLQFRLGFRRLERHCRGFHGLFLLFLGGTIGGEHVASIAMRRFLDEHRDILYRRRSIRIGIVPVVQIRQSQNHLILIQHQLVYQQRNRILIPPLHRHQLLQRLPIHTRLQRPINHPQRPIDILRMTLHQPRGIPPSFLLLY